MTLLKQIFVLLLGTLPGILFYLVPFALDLFTSAMPILFYRGLFFAGIIAILHFGLLLLARDRAAFETKLAAVALAASFNVCFLVIFPVTIDRSISVYLLNQIATHDQGYTEQELEALFIQQYVVEFQAIERRMDEQMASNNLTRINDRYRITDQGRSFLRFSRRLGQLFHTDTRILTESPPANFLKPSSERPDEGTNQ